MEIKLRHSMIVTRPKTGQSGFVVGCHPIEGGRWELMWHRNRVETDTVILDPCEKLLLRAFDRTRLVIPCEINGTCSNI